MLSSRSMKRSLFAVLAAGVLATSGTAEAGRRRAVDTPPPTPGSASGPATPEPTAGLAFALGLGAVVWAVRRQRK